MYTPPAIGPAGKSARRLCSANSTIISRPSINRRRLVETHQDRESRVARAPSPAAFELDLGFRGRDARATSIKPSSVEADRGLVCFGGNAMKQSVSRRQFLQASAIAGAGLALPQGLLAARKKSVLIFTKSSGFEHQVIKSSTDNPASWKRRSRLWAISMALTSPPPKTDASSIPPTSASIPRCFSSLPWI